MAAASHARALRTAIGLTVGFVNDLHERGALSSAHHLQSYVDSLKASGLRDGHVMAALLSVVNDEMRRHTGEPNRALEPLAAGRIDEMLEKFEHDALLLHAEGSVWTGRAARVRQVTQFIEKHYHELVTLERLAAKVGRRRVSLATEFRSETGITIHEYLTRVRIRRAADLLRTSHKIESVSLSVGYHCKKNFYRHFKALMGMTPGAYQKQQQTHVAGAVPPAHRDRRLELKAASDLSRSTGGAVAVADNRKTGTSEG